MRYVILIHHNPQSQALWKAMSAEQRGVGLAAYEALTVELVDSGELVVAEALADPALGLRVTVGEDGRPQTDGPYAELKEYVAGFFLIDCDNPRRAAEIAAQVPEADLGMVELRPVMDLSGLEM